MENKNKYENVIIIKKTQTEEEYKQVLNVIIEKIKNIIDIEKVDEVGLKNLAYEVKNNKKGYYVVIYFKSISENIKELERYYRIEDNILKFIIVKQEN